MLPAITKFSVRRINKEAVNWNTTYRSPVLQHVLFCQKKMGPKAWRQWKHALSLWVSKDSKLYDPL